MKKTIIFTLILTFITCLGAFAGERYVELNTADLRPRTHTTSHVFSNLKNIALLFKISPSRGAAFDHTAPYQGSPLSIHYLYLDTTTNRDSYAYLLYALANSTRIVIRYETEKRPGPPWNDKKAAEITGIEIIE